MSWARKLGSFEVLTFATARTLAKACGQFV
jgi:hypothetical protein